MSVSDDYIQSHAHTHTHTHTLFFSLSLLLSSPSLLYTHGRYLASFSYFSLHCSLVFFFSSLLSFFLSFFLSFPYETL